MEADRIEMDIEHQRQVDENEEPIELTQVKSLGDKIVQQRLEENPYLFAASFLVDFRKLHKTEERRKLYEGLTEAQKKIVLDYLSDVEKQQLVAPRKNQHLRIDDVLGKVDLDK